MKRHFITIIIALIAMSSTVLSALHIVTLASVSGVFRNPSFTSPVMVTSLCAQLLHTAAMAMMMVMICLFILLYFFLGFLFQ